jgi:hypothetical protein
VYDTDRMDRTDRVMTDRAVPYSFEDGDDDDGDDDGGGIVGD